MQVVIGVLIIGAALLALLAFVRPKRDEGGELVGATVNLVGVVLTVLIAVVALFALLPSYGEVPSGHRAVVLRFNAPTGEVKGEGAYLVLPVVERAQLIDCQIHAHKAPASAASRDMQDVATEVTVNYWLDPTAVVTTWRTLGLDYEQRIIAPTVQEAVKAATARYDAEQLITKRAEVREDIVSILRERLGRHHVLLDQLSITDFRFSDAFSDAIEGKQVATQNALRAQNAVVEARARADSAIAIARGTAEAIRIQADAIRAQGGAEYVQLQAIKAWGGDVPMVVGSLSSVPFIDLTKLTK